MIRARLGRLPLLPVLVLAGLALLTLLAGQLAPQDPNAVDAINALKEPSSSNLLGTDALGRDELSRVIVAARTTLVAVGVVVVAGAAFGLLVGVVAGYVGGLADEVIMRVVDGFLWIPTLLASLAILGTLGPGYGNLLLALAIASWAPYARIARSRVLVVRRSAHIEALEVMGASRSRIVLRHLVPAAVGPVVVFASTDAGAITLVLATLSFLGLGVQPPTPEWGQMITEARPYIESLPWLTLAPGLCITALVVTFNLVGESLAEASGEGVRSRTLGTLFGRRLPRRPSPADPASRADAAA